VPVYSQHYSYLDATTKHCYKRVRSTNEAAGIIENERATTRI